MNSEPTTSNETTGSTEVIVVLIDRMMTWFSETLARSEYVMRALSESDRSLSFTRSKTTMVS